MRIKQIITDEDKKNLEYMLKFKYRMPYVPFGNEELSRKLIHILTPILYPLSGLVYYIGNYIAFSFVLLVAILSTRWIIGCNTFYKVDNMVSFQREKI
ncbi:MAG: hypothetical protein ACLTK7_14080 [Clostridium paraputrificum]|uniref:hypothetical protein n=1 Tax=Clostridium paraputrificum TaxID=29363 RepID=UPI000C08BFDA|nr:hypothetical protein [Clostridium paraputrificum]